MAVGGNEPTRKRKSMRNMTWKTKRTRTNIREDRLSSLPDDILIEILSYLPLRLAMATGSLSWRWRYLWTNVTSIHIESNKLDYSRDIDSTFNNIITRITSPLIHSFSVELGDIRHMPRYVEYPKGDLNYSWLRQICDQNVRQLKITNTRNNISEVDVTRIHGYVKRGLPRNLYHDYLIQIRLTLPSYIFVTQSLVSIELDTKLKLQLPDDEDRINLPNLKKLHLCSTSINVESLEKLIKACPSLEELGFVHTYCVGPYGPVLRICRNGLTRLCYINFSHQNLQRLFIKNLPNKYRVVVNAPKLEYLAIRASKSAGFRFEEEPMMLCEAKIDLNVYKYYNIYNCVLTEDEIKSMTKFYGVFRKVTILTPDVFVLKNSWPSNMFCNATQLTLSITASCNINILLAMLELCPVLDALTLQIGDTDGMERAAEVPGHVSTLQRVLKTIKMEINCNTDDKTTKAVVELVEYLLSNSVDLKQFHVTVDSSSHRMESTEDAQIREMKLSKLLYQCPVLSEGCEVKFVGRFFKMSRKAGHKFLIANGKDSPIN
ncbi:F-box/FBD/LRR-repeat protein At5g22660-like [Silene latifolia]|uniref:F-box/FBD/LRR-repeat protein At5g22660-like n=1 Tax=Silene latifolia TaxID=37657 RepID=UPI003D76F268